MQPAARLAQHAAMACVGVLLILSAVCLIADGYTPARAAGLALLLIVLLAMHFMRRAHAPSAAPQDPAAHPATSLVLLLREPRYLDLPLLADLARKAWAIDLAHSANAAEFIAGRLPTFQLRAAGRLFAVNSFGVPYFADAAATAAQVGELRVRKTIADHAAWLSIDLLDPADGSDDAEAYRWMGKLLAELIDDDCLAILCPAIGGINVPFGQDLPAVLRSTRPLSVFDRFATAPVLSLPEDDPALQFAEAEARRRWPEFVDAFEQRTDRQHFSIKAPFSDGRHTEFMWAAVTAIENNIIYGQLGNQPLHLRHLKDGDRVKIPLDKLNDWVFVTDAGMHGGFTIQAINRQNNA